MLPRRTNLVVFSAIVPFVLLAQVLVCCSHCVHPRLFALLGNTFGDPQPLGTHSRLYRQVCQPKQRQAAANSSSASWKAGPGIT
ncbi:hypothetical protein COO60DRAFT_1537414 [Scenedesmus sp. NREL 46B-D3]|nr:hypothetical protein COO60DRAFT_1537414 [Scenedesmus sp. NREL 46B-D3]